MPGSPVPSTTGPFVAPEPGSPVRAPDALPSAPLVQVPSGCPAPPVASVVFVGRIVAKDYRAARFQIEQVRAGTVAGEALGDLLDVRYDADIQFLNLHDRYLVGAAPRPTDRVLMSKVRAAEPLFGGNAVIGLTDKSLQCPVVEDPVRTFHVDATEIDAGMFGALVKDKKGIGLAVLKPALAVFLVVFALAIIRWLFTAIFVSVRRAAEGEPVRRADRSD